MFSSTSQLIEHSLKTLKITENILSKQTNGINQVLKKPNLVHKAIGTHNGVFHVIFRVFVKIIGFSVMKF